MLYGFHQNNLEDNYECGNQDVINDLIDFKKRMNTYPTEQIQKYMVADVCTERHYPKGTLKTLTKVFVCGCKCHRVGIKFIGDD